MKRYVCISLTLFAVSVTNVVTYFLLGIIMGDMQYSNIFSLTYPLQFVCSILLSYFATASNIRTNREKKEGCSESGMLLGLLFAIVVFSIVIILIDDYIAFMNMDKKIFHFFTIMAVGELFFSFVINMISEKLYFQNKDKLANMCNLFFIVLNLLSVVITALIIKNQMIIMIVNLIVLAIYSIVWLCLNIKKFKFNFNPLKNLRYESLFVLGDIFMFIIYFVGFSRAFGFGEQYILALNLVNLITDPVWDALGAIPKIAKIDISQSRFNYKKALKYSAIITGIYTLVCIVLFFSLSKLYDIVLTIGLVYLSIQLLDFIVNIFKSNLQIFLQLEHSALKSTIIHVGCKFLRTILSVVILSPYNTNIAQIICGVLGLSAYLILRFKYFKLNEEGVLVSKVLKKDISQNFDTEQNE